MPVEIPSPTPTATDVPATETCQGSDERGRRLNQRLCDNGGGAICNLMRTVLPDTFAPVVAALIAIVLVLLIALIFRNVGPSADHPGGTRGRPPAARPWPGACAGGSRSTPEGLDAIVAERRRQRAETMGSVLKHIASIVILGTGVLTVLDKLSIPIAPLLTSVGIVGVAIGFGAQELVKDFIAGMFMLLEDQYGVGDVIDSGAAIGTVEAVTLRITRLRDTDGRVWYVRNGTITRVGNESPGLVPRRGGRAGLLHRRHPRRPRAPGAGGRGDLGRPLLPRLRHRRGAAGLGDRADLRQPLVFRISAKTLPSKQAQVARELRLRVKSALDAPALRCRAPPT